MAVHEAELFTAPLHGVEAHNRSRGKGAHVRGHGWPSSRRRATGEHRGEFRRHDVGETVMPGAMVLATFAETKVARSRSGRNNSLHAGTFHGSRQNIQVHVMNAVITKSTARITIEENTTVRVVEYATPSLVGGAV